MNYTLIGHTEDTAYRDRWGELIEHPGSFTTLFFREEHKAAFLKAWATAKFNNAYEDLIILLNGIPDSQLEGEEWDQYEDLERERDALYDEVKAEHDEADRLRKEAVANAALEKARQIAAHQRARDLADLDALERRLGLK